MNMDQGSGQKRAVDYLYPPIEPFDQRVIDMGDGHRIYVEQSGRPDGMPVLVLHGGPGGGCSPAMRRYFDPNVYRIAADLVERGTDDTAVQDMIFNSQTEKNLRLLGHCLSNRMEFYPEYRTALIWLSKKDYEQFNIQRGDTEGIVNYLLSVRDVKLAAFIHNQPTVVKLSLRSKGDLDVQEICKKHFNGGGHKNASGAYSHESLKATIDKFKNLLPEYKEQLLK
jgi:nanoRNase/pAp phosphatase (c-di-AMP/oligoRNAs hydrolase)